jgi:uncharacterized delta-60 repeat protein
MKKAVLPIISVALVLLPSVLLGQSPDTLWTRWYQGPVNVRSEAYGCEVDDVGNLYVAGNSYNGVNYYFLVIKYNCDGDTLWARLYNDTANDQDYGYGCAVDDSGNIYVTGRSNDGTKFVFLTVKFNSYGDTLWSRRYSASNGSAYAQACAVDSSGNLYVTGWYNGSTSIDYLTIKYNSSGDTLWTRSYNGPADNSDEAKGCTVDGSGNVYVVGQSYGSMTSLDYLTIKYNSVGETLWTRRYNGLASGNDYANDCVIDDSGNVFVTGYSYHTSNFDFLTIKYNPVGDTLWTRWFNGPGNSDDCAYACAVDRSGNIYIAGSTYNGLYCDYLIIKYNATGDTFWTCQYNGLSDNNDYAKGCAVDSLSYLYVSGLSSDGISFGSLTIKYNNTTTGVAGKPELPITFSKLRLDQNKPNPFSQHTTISYQLPASGTASLNIYNAAGQLVKTFNMGQQQAGHHQVEWSDSKITAGVYFYRLTAGNYQTTKKLVVVK